MKDILGIGIIGVGNISFVHEAGYNESSITKIVALSDLNNEIGMEKAKEHDAKFYSNFEDLINDKNVDIVDICLPHYLHYKAAKLALEKGKHVIIEKPITTNYEQAIDLIEESKKMNVKFTVAENTRFVKLYLKAKEMLDSGKIGEVWHIRTFISGSEVERLSDKNNWIGKREKGGGIIIDAGVHTFYLLRWLFGNIKKINSITWSKIKNTEVEDNALILGILDNNVQFVSQLSDTAQYPWNERLEIFGSKGVIIGDQLNNPPLKIYEGPLDDEGLEIKDVEFNPTGWKILSIIDEIKDFVESVADNREPKVRPEDAAYAVKIAELAYLNSKFLE